MPAPANRQEFPEPSRNWRGLDEVDAAPSRSLSKIARLWSPVRAILETPVATLARYAHRVVDRGTGIPYSADELEAKILAQAGSGTTDSLTTSDGTAAAAAGKIGEYVEATRALADLLALSNATVANICSVSLTAGDWDVSGVVTFDLISATVSGKSAKTTQTSANGSVDGTNVFDSRYVSGATEITSLSTPVRRFLLSAPATIYLTASCAFSGGTVKAAGFLSARRVR